jgi:very-short-patch-repair endonuclease
LRGKNQKHVERARSFRRALTPAEFALWTRIRGRQLGGFKFVRQEPMDQYYVGYRVIRVWNNDVIENLDGVLQMLPSELERWPLSPQAGRGR